MSTRGTSGEGARGTLRVGTSGWSYDHWRGNFYPEHLPTDERLAHYASEFDTVEINSTFYGLPKEDAVRHWYESVPEGFVFAVKGSRYITHVRRLRDVQDDIDTLMWRMRRLESKIGPILWQLPPTLKYDARLLDEFLSALPDTARHAIEFRDDSWLRQEVFDLLAHRGVAIVNVSGDQLTTDYTPTSSFIYARFHGTKRYHGSYDRPRLEPWAEFLGSQLAAGKDCYTYFNNDIGGHAPKDARRLREMLTQTG